MKLTKPLPIDPPARDLPRTDPWRRELALMRLSTLEVRRLTHELVADLRRADEARRARFERW